MDKAIASVGVEKYKTEFGNTATRHKWIGHGWLMASIVSIAATIAAPIVIHANYPLQPGPQGEWLTLENINVTTIKVFVVFTLFFVVSQCVKNYKANRHLQMTNLHRSLALLTFTTFVDRAGEDQVVKNAVLVEATKTIFAPGSTGYAPAENDGPEARLIEIINTIKK